MSERFKSKYRTKSLRKINWNYGWNGYYFLTICTIGKDCCFGNIVNGKMILSETGILAHKFWKEITKKYEYINLDEYQIMPNHIHGILQIDKMDSYRRDAINRVSTTTFNTTGGVTGKNNPMLHDNLSRIIRWYKGRSSFEIRKTYPEFKWQSNFYDVIINDDLSLNRIRDYIKKNPENWDNDEYKL